MGVLLLKVSIIKIRPSRWVILGLITLGEIIIGLLRILCEGTARRILQDRVIFFWNIVEL
jgi:hypothetical protein